MPLNDIKRFMKTYRTKSTLTGRNVILEDKVDVPMRISKLNSSKGFKDIDISILDGDKTRHINANLCSKMGDIQIHENESIKYESGINALIKSSAEIKLYNNKVNTIEYHMTSPIHLYDDDDNEIDGKVEFSGYNIDPKLSYAIKNPIDGVYSVEYETHYKTNRRVIKIKTPDVDFILYERIVDPSFTGNGNKLISADVSIRAYDSGSRVMIKEHHHLVDEELNKIIGPNLSKIKDQLDVVWLKTALQDRLPDTRDLFTYYDNEVIAFGDYEITFDQVCETVHPARMKEEGFDHYSVVYSHRNNKMSLFETGTCTKDESGKTVYTPITIHGWKLKVVGKPYTTADINFSLLENACADERSKRDLKFKYKSDEVFDPDEAVEDGMIIKAIITENKLIDYGDGSLTISKEYDVEMYEDYDDIDS